MEFQRVEGENVVFASLQSSYSLKQETMNEIRKTTKINLRILNFKKFIPNFHYRSCSRYGFLFGTYFFTNPMCVWIFRTSFVCWFELYVQSYLKNLFVDTDDVTEQCNHTHGWMNFLLN